MGCPVHGAWAPPIQPQLWAGIREVPVTFQVHLLVLTEAAQLWLQLFPDHPLWNSV